MRKMSTHHVPLSKRKLIELKLNNLSRQLKNCTDFTHVILFYFLLGNPEIYANESAKKTKAQNSYFTDQTKATNK